MSFTIPPATNNAGTAIPVGLYTVRLKALEHSYQEEGPFGPGDRVKWIFTVEQVIDSDDEDAESKVGEELWAYTSLSMGRKAKMRGYVEALMGRTLEDGEGIAPEDLIDRRAKASVVPHERQDGTMTTKVGSLLPARKAAPVGAAKGPAETDLF